MVSQAWMIRSMAHATAANPNGAVTTTEEPYPAQARPDNGALSPGPSPASGRGEEELAGRRTGSSE